MAVSRWHFGQCFGDRDSEDDLNEADVLSAVEFDGTGDYLATGDKGGRIVIFERADGGKGAWKPRRAVADGDLSLSSVVMSRGQGGGRHGGSIDDDMGGAGGAGSEYRFHTEFQSHTAEFDYLKSVEIEEKINKIAWCRRSSESLQLLSTNDKTVKLWRIHEQNSKVVASFNVETGRFGGRVPVTSLKIPALVPGPGAANEPCVTATPRRIYGNAHAYHINSVSLCSDGVSFLSADDLRINLWSLENAKLAFNVLDMKPPTLEELTEVITTATFHPNACSVFAYASSRGSVKMGDLRDAALCDMHAKAYSSDLGSSGGGGDAGDGGGIGGTATDTPGKANYFAEIIASVSDIAFARDGRYLIARDYLSIKVWDIAMESRPVRVIPVHEHLRPRLPALYESDYIFDKFEAGATANGSSIITGSYNGTFKVFDTARNTETTVELARGAGGGLPPVVRSIPSGVSLTSRQNGSGGGGGSSMAMCEDDDSSVSSLVMPMEGLMGGNVDFDRKVLHFSTHPFEDCVAVAGRNNLLIYRSS